MLQIWWFKKYYLPLNALKESYGKIVITKQLNDLWNECELDSTENFGMRMCRLAVQLYSKEMIYDRTMFFVF